MGRTRAFIILFGCLAVLIGGLFVAENLSIARGPRSPRGPVHPHEAELKNPDGTWKYTNALSHQTSPYLLQHAHNPVEWYPWGAEAFERARRTGKLIFLSVGYSTCYWCHVMERQVFENPRLAALLNEHCISIKVDREERPDVDEIYMTAVQMMTQHGGWPMSVFLTPPGAGGKDDPGLKPFWAGTYIPPEPRHGLPGFAQLIGGIAKAWKTRRAGIIEQADRVALGVRQHLDTPGDPKPLGAESVKTTANQLMRMYDPTHGGFGQAPKFPQPSNLLFLMGVYKNNPNQDLWGALSYTLERMARGGVYDQIGGGFHRYSTDEKWLVPHFEKMLYDNAQLVEAYVQAHTIHPDGDDPGLYARVVREVCDYVLREMTDATGAFWSAQDAEVDAREGGNYVWTAKQVRDAISDEAMAGLAVRMYGLDRGTNFQDPHHRDEPPTNVLYLPDRLDVFAKKEKMSPARLVGVRAEINARMLAVRAKRKQPSTDDKVLVSWNGLMIAALARAGRVLDEPGYTRAAARAAGYILEHMRQGEGDRGLYRTMRGGEAKIPAFLEDYAFFVHGLIELHRATGEDRWLTGARELMAYAQEQFSAQETRGGGYYDTLANQSDLFVRTVSVYDGAIPSGNSQMIHNWMDLYDLTGEAAYLDRAVADLGAFAGALVDRGAGMVHMQHALLRAMSQAPKRFAATPSNGKEQVGKTDQPVSVSVEPEVVDLSTGSSRLRVTLKVEPGYHLNASDAGLIGLIPTTLTLEAPEGLTLSVDYPAGVTKRYPFAEEALKIYEGVVVLDATLRKTGGAGGASGDTPAGARLVLRYQVCTDSSCLEPQEVELPVGFRGFRGFRGDQ